MTPLDRAVQFIKLRGSARTPDIAKVLAIPPGDVDELLAGPRERGFLITCKVETAGELVTEYRCSILGGGQGVRYKPGRPRRKAPDPVKARLLEWGAHPQPSAGAASVASPKSPLAQPHAAAPRSAEDPHQEDQMDIEQKIIAALEKHGPMDSRGMRRYVNSGDLAGTMRDMAKAGTLEKAGGGPRSTVYALPGKKGDRAPAPRVPPQRINGSPYAATIADLEGKKAALLDEVGKLDRAIEAVRAIAG